MADIYLILFIVADPSVLLYRKRINAFLVKKKNRRRGKKDRQKFFF